MVQLSLFWKKYKYTYTQSCQYDYLSTPTSLLYYAIAVIVFQGLNEKIVLHKLQTFIDIISLTDKHIFVNCAKEFKF